MAKQINHSYQFGSVRLDATNRLLYKDGIQLPVQPRAIETLLVLVKNAQAVVDKDTLLDAVWRDVAVEEGALKRNIYLLRKALGKEGRFIETLPKRGYRFIAEVKEDWGESELRGVEEAPGELVLRRRASLLVRHEEEASDSSEPHLKEFSEGRFSGSLRRYWPAISAAAVVLALAVFGFWRVFDKLFEGQAAPVESIAVLPFRNLGASGDAEHLGTGLADVLITRLSNIKELKVRPTSAVLRFNQSEQDSVAAGRMLGVDAVLEGNIHRAGDRMRVTARLVRVSDQQPIWAGQFDEKADAFFLVQDTIAQQVASSLALSLSLGEKSALAKRYTESADAYHLYVTGRYHWNKRNTDGIVQAESYFRRAIEKDPTFALAYLGLADTLSMAPVGFQSEAEYAIERAIELDDKLGEAYASRGFWRTVRAWQWDEAEADFKQALELNPGYGTAHQWYATLLAIRGRVEEAKAEMQRALEIDPTSHNFLADMGQMHYFAREYDEAESYCLKALEIYPDFLFAHCNLREIYLKKGEDDKAFDAELKVDEALRPSPGYSKVSEILAGAQAGARETYRRLGLKGILRKRVRNAFSDYSRLFDYAVLGERDRALEALERSYETHEFLLPFVNVDPLFDDLRLEPRFQAVFRRMGLAR